MTKRVGAYESELDLEIDLGLDVRFTGSPTNMKSYVYRS